jgi:hypothetical protein
MMEEIDVIERKRAYKRDWKPDLARNSVPAQYESPTRGIKRFRLKHSLSGRRTP